MLENEIRKLKIDKNKKKHWILCLKITNNSNKRKKK